MNVDLGIARTASEDVIAQGVGLRGPYGDVPGISESRRETIMCNMPNVIQQNISRLCLIQCVR